MGASYATSRGRRGQGIAGAARGGRAACRSTSAPAGSRRPRARATASAQADLLDRLDDAEELFGLAREDLLGAGDPQARRAVPIPRPGALGAWLPTGRPGRDSIPPSRGVTMSEAASDPSGSASASEFVAMGQFGSTSSWRATSSVVTSMPASATRTSSWRRT